MKSQRRRLFVLCEDALHQRFVECLADRYKPNDEAGREVARKIQHGEYSPRRASDAWTPPAHDEEIHVPALTDARSEVLRLGL
jgi:hypothetical protein